METVKRLSCGVKGQIGVDESVRDAGGPYSRMPSKQKAGYDQHTSPPLRERCILSEVNDLNLKVNLLVWKSWALLNLGGS